MSLWFQRADLVGLAVQVVLDYRSPAYGFGRITWSDARVSKVRRGWFPVMWPVLYVCWLPDAVGPLSLHSHSHGHHDDARVQTVQGAQSPQGFRTTALPPRPLLARTAPPRVKARPPPHRRVQWAQGRSRLRERRAAHLPR